MFGDDIVCHTVQVGSSPSPENSATIAVEFQGNGHLACENIHTFCLFSSLQVLHWDLNYACLFIFCHCGGKLIVISSIICHFSIFNLTTLKLHHKLSLTYTHTHYTLHTHTHTHTHIRLLSVSNMLEMCKMNGPKLTTYSHGSSCGATGTPPLIIPRTTLTLSSSSSS